MKEQIEILRRIAERGLAEAQRSAPTMIDSWQHMIDEIARLKFQHDAPEIGLKRWARV